MADNPASSGDLTKRSLRALTTAEIAWGTIRLDDAFDQLVTRKPTIETKLDGLAPGSRFSKVVIQVVVAMVLRVLANPDYLRQTSVDDATSILDQAVSSGALQPTDDELDLLTASADGTDGAWSVRALPAACRFPSDPAAVFTGTMSNIL